MPSPLMQLPDFGDDPQTDGGVIDGSNASTLVEMLSNLRAASASGEQAKKQELAKRPKPEISISLIDGVPHLHAKNVAMTDPNTEVTSARNKPYSDWANRLMQQLGEVQRYGDSLPSPDDPSLDTNLSSRAGRVALAKELGLKDPADVPGRFLKLGYADYREERSRYEDLVGDPAKLSQAVRAKRLQDRLNVAKEGQPLVNELQDVEARQRATDAAVRAEESQSRAERNFVFQKFTSRDEEDTLARQGSLESALKLAKADAGPYWNDEVHKPLVEAAYARGKQALADADAKRKRDDEMVQMRRENQTIREENLDIRKRAIDDREARANVPRRSMPTSKAYLDTRTADDLIEAAGSASRNEGRYSEDSVFEGIDVARERWNDEFNTNIDKASTLRKQVQAAHLSSGKIDPMKQTDVAKWEGEITQLAHRNLKLKGDLQKLAVFFNSQDRASAPGRKPQVGDVKKFDNGNVGRWNGTGWAHVNKQ